MRAMTRYFGPGFTGTVETIFRLAEARNSARWAADTMPEAERKFWEKIRCDLADGRQSIEYATLKERAQIEVPRPHDANLMARYRDIVDARRALRLALDGGNIRAIYRDERGDEHDIPRSFWGGDDEIVVIALLDGIARLDSPSKLDKGVSRLIRLPEAEIEHVWPELAAHDSLVPNAGEMDQRKSLHPLREVEIESLLREQLLENPNLTGNDAFKIARERGAIMPREKIREIYRSLGGSTKPGPKGPRKNRATGSA
jgi:hypothetical protein